MNILRMTLATLLVASTTACFAADEIETIEPQEHYGIVAKRLINALERRHVLRQPCDDVISQRAWTNLVTYYDANRSVFLKSDLDILKQHELTIDDELKQGDVSFGFEVYRLYCERLRERVEFATNLLVKAEWDFSVDENYTFKRDEAEWPATREEAEALWAKRMKNEVLAQVIARELDAEENEEKKAKKPETEETPAKPAADEALSKPASDEKSNSEDASAIPAAESKPASESEGKPKATPEENLIKRYRMLAIALMESDAETVLQTYLSALCRGYDPHTDYLSPATKEDFDMGMNLKLCGVGAVLSTDEGAVKIVEVMPGGPMAVDGRIKAGDKIVGVKQGDGEMEDILWQPLRKTVRKIRGEKGTRVTLEVIPRNDPTGGSHKLIELVRDEIQLDDQRTTGRVERVTLDRRERKIGYVKVPEFYGSMDRNPGDEGYVSCAADVLKYIIEFNTQNVEGMVLDLRGNGGGSLPEAIKMSALFVQAGPVVLVRDATGAAPIPIERGNAVAFKKPLIVMIDRNSASASEIVAGHLRDVGRAIVVGDVRSHGKGTVQTVMPLGKARRTGDDGEPDEEIDFGSTKITTMRFYRVNGRSTQVKGVASDLHLPSFLDSLDIGEEKLPYALPFSRIRGPVVRDAWNLPTYVPTLVERSKVRTEKDEKFVKHVKNVADYKALFDRTEVPLERTARKNQMKADRQIRELEDGDEEDGDDEDDAEILARRRRKKDKRDDIVLDETFRVMDDLLELTKGATQPPAPIDWYNAILGF